jgi:hypothetical protein
MQDRMNGTSKNYCRIKKCLIVFGLEISGKEFIRESQAQIEIT